MLTEICQELRNWFDKERYIGNISIDAEGTITMGGAEIPLVDGQYFRVIGSIFNDGVHVFPSTTLQAEDFDGAIWAMAVPPAVISLAGEIEAWQAKNGSLDSANMSPFNSESFGGYSYSKSGGGSADGNGSAAGTWQGAFAKRLNMWRKI